MGKWNEPVDEDLGRRHEAFIFPLFRERERFSGIEHFHLFDHRSSSGDVHGDVYAFVIEAPMVVVPLGLYPPWGQVCG